MLGLDIVAQWVHNGYMDSTREQQGGTVITLDDARSYFSADFEEKLTSPAEVGRQLYLHRAETDTHEIVREAILTLAAFQQAKTRARAKSRALTTLAGQTMFDLVWSAGGAIEYGKLIIAAERKHKRAGSRVRRVYEQMERDGVFAIDYPDAFSRDGAPLTVRIADEIRSRPVDVELCAQYGDPESYTPEATDAVRAAAREFNGRGRNDHSASRRVDVLANEAPHLLAQDEPKPKPLRIVVNMGADEPELLGAWQETDDFQVWYTTSDGHYRWAPYDCVRVVDVTL